MSKKGRRYLIGTVLTLVAWYVCVLFVWALQPLNDSIPVGVEAKSGRAISQTVECNTLFSGAARSADALPTLIKPYAYPRAACSLVHDQARTLFILNTVLVVAGLVVAAAIAVRLAKRGPEPTLVKSTVSLV